MGDVIVAVLDDMSLKPITTLVHHANLHNTENRRQTQSMRDIAMTYTVIQMMMLIIVMTLLVIVTNNVIVIMIISSSTLTLILTIDNISHHVGRDIDAPQLIQSTRC